MNGPLKPYLVTVNGIETTLMLSELDAQARGYTADQIVTDSSAPTQTPPATPPFPVAGDALEADQDAWIKDANVDAVIAAVGAQPDITEAVIAAEERRGDKARKTLLDKLKPAS